MAGNRPILLDLFCGAGGAATGYHRAGFEVVGVDIKPMPNYPFKFVQADAMTYSVAGFDAVHASPPCQDHSSLNALHDDHGTGWMLDGTIERLQEWGGPRVIENVGAAKSSFCPTFMLCGSMFGLQVRRHRKFWSSVPVWTPRCNHAAQGTPLGVYGNGGGGQMTRGVKATPAQARVAMGVDWMTHKEIAQAIPPAYTEFIGTQLLQHLEVAA